MSKKMKNAPVYFTLAQVRHNPVLMLRDYAPAIQEKMRRAGYPDFKSGLAMAINLTPAIVGEDAQPQAPTVQTIERYRFGNVDSTRGFIVEQGALSFQVTEYDTFETFSAEFFMGLEIVHECMHLDFSERIGLRYLDAVSPSGGEAELPEFLATGVLGISARLPETAKVALSMSETHIQTEVGNVLSRTIIQGGPLGFPMDLQPQGLVVAERFRQINGVHAIIDTDASYEVREAFSLEALGKRLSALHLEIRKAFDATVTDHAMRVWK